MHLLNLAVDFESLYLFQRPINLCICHHFFLKRKLLLEIFFPSLIASKIFLLFPEVDKAIKTSPLPAKAFICLENIFSKPKSFEMQVIEAGSLNKDIDLSGILFYIFQ